MLKPMRHRCALAGLVLLVGCGDHAPAPPPTPGPAAHATASPLPAPPAEPAHHLLRFRASDGRRPHGRLTPPGRPRARAVVLVHGLYGRPSQWDQFAGELHRAGFATLA